MGSDQVSGQPGAAALLQLSMCTASPPILLKPQRTVAVATALLPLATAQGDGAAMQLDRQHQHGSHRSLLVTAKGAALHMCTAGCRLHVACRPSVPAANWQPIGNLQVAHRPERWPLRQRSAGWGAEGQYVAVPVGRAAPRQKRSHATAVGCAAGSASLDSCGAGN